MRVDCIKSDISFKANGITLFSDFDGTFLQAGAQNEEYFQAFDNFRQERDGKFKFFITTGRRLDGGRSGFATFYEKLRLQNGRFPQLDGVITSDGGDVFMISSSGDIDRNPLMQKRAAVKEKTGWQFDNVRQGIENIASRLKMAFTLNDERGFHRVSVFLEDETRMDEFMRETSRFFDENEISAEVKNRANNINLAPVINGRRVHKDFDVKLALETAIKENDFIIAAGNEMNDRELLNLFNYAGFPKISSAEKIPLDRIGELSERINKLPIGVIFVDTPEEFATAKQRELKKFMEAQQKLFPDKVRIVEPSVRQGENTLVNACRELTEKFFGKPNVQPQQSPVSKNKPKSKDGWILVGIFSALSLAGIAVSSYKNRTQTRKD